MKKMLVSGLFALSMVSFGGNTAAQAGASPLPQAGPDYAAAVDFLARYGAESKDPMALLLAARMIGKEKVAVASSSKNPGTAVSGFSPIEPVRLLEQAEKLATGNDTLLSEIRREKNSFDGIRWWGARYCQWQYYCWGGYCSYYYQCY